MKEFDETLEILTKKLHDQIQSDKKIILVDVQKLDDFQSWNVLNSMNIPLDDLEELEDFPEIFKNTPIVTICQSGNKSKIAAKILQENNFNALSLHGGLKDWSNILDPIDISIEGSDIQITQLRRIAKGCLSYIISYNDEAAIIDPAYNTEKYLEIINDRGLEVKYIFDTHLHADHISGTRKLAKQTSADLHLSNNDPFIFDFKPIKNAEDFRLAGKTVISSIAAPGHTKGSTVYRIQDLGILSGDTVFVDGVGRPDLANRSEEFAEDLYETISNKIVTLPRNMFVAPSHHGKFMIEHIHHPITSEIKNVNDYQIVNLSKEEFIAKSVKSSNAIPRPPSYETIIRINSGEIDATDSEITNLEAGPNRCAIN